MKWSWKIGRLAGIDLQIHATFLLLIGWVALSHWRQGHNLAGAMGGVLFTLALFGCVLLHELGHALAARRYGIATRDITLLPIGGVARLERMPENPRHELWVALAGPAVNVAIAAVLGAWLAGTRLWVPVESLSVTGGPFLERLFMANVTLVAFNLIPAFPMDGGRVLRALLAGRMDYTRATKIAAGLGQGLALLFGFVGLLYNPILAFVALFVWIGAAQEASAVEMKSALGGTPVRAAMLTDFRILEPSQTLADAVRLVIESSQADFPVVERQRAVGILTRTDMLAALADHGERHPVTEVMRRDFAVAEHSEMLEGALGRLQEFDCHTMAVTMEGRLVGLVTSDNLGEYFLIQAALQKRGAGLGGTAVS
jgi:Zn-dependent protease/CBS domain-containing protein